MASRVIEDMVHRLELRRLEERVRKYQEEDRQRLQQAIEDAEPPPELIGDPGIQYCLCPCCQTPFAVHETHLGKLLWCVCGKLMKLAIGTGLDAIPPEPAIIEVVEASLECFGCHRWTDWQHIRAIDVPGEACDGGEAVPITVKVCIECLTRARVR